MLKPIELAALNLLQHGEQRGADMRQELASQKKMSGPAFYFMMAQLEQAGYVKGREKPTTIRGFTMRSRWYQILPEGLAVCANYSG